MNFSFIRDFTPIQPIHDDNSWEGSTYSMFKAVHKTKSGYLTAVRICRNNVIEILIQTYDNDWNELPGNILLGREIQAEDPRIIEIEGKIYIIFIGNSPLQGQFKCIWLHEYNTQKCIPLFIEGVLNKIEKNWAPFNHNGKLMFVYNYDPLIVLYCDSETGKCKCVIGKLPFPTHTTFIRGGSNLIKMGNHYVGFAHSRLPIETHNPKFLHLTHMVKLSDKMELVYVSDPIPYIKNNKIVKETIQDPVSFWVEDDKIFISSNMRDNYCEMYSLENFGNWNNITKTHLERWRDNVLE